MSDIVVIGGGAAGMMAAVFAARAGANVTLLEKNEKLGKKVYITGKGRCNLTNDCDRDEFLAQVPRNPRFLYSALNFFAPRDMMALLEENGCPVTVQRGKRVFQWIFHHNPSFYIRLDNRTGEISASDSGTDVCDHGAEGVQNSESVHIGQRPGREQKLQSAAEHAALRKGDQASGEIRTILILPVLRERQRSRPCDRS